MPIAGSLIKWDLFIKGSDATPGKLSRREEFGYVKESRITPKQKYPSKKMENIKILEHQSKKKGLNFVLSMTIVAKRPSKTCGPIAHEKTFIMHSITRIRASLRCFEALFNLPKVPLINHILVNKAADFSLEPAKENFRADIAFLPEITKLNATQRKIILKFALNCTSFMRMPKVSLLQGKIIILYLLPSISPLLSSCLEL